MSQKDTPPFAAFGKLVPGFDFLQNLSQQAGSATAKSPQIPGMSNWVAPTLNVEDLDKRIEELKSVQFWLDQNATALKATIQALELQKMTLATLKGMNLNMEEVAQAFTVNVANMTAGFKPAAAEKGPDPVPAQAAPAAEPSPKDTTTQSAKAPGAVDPMQWWGALTQQFQQIAGSAMQEAAKHSAATAPQKTAAPVAAKTGSKTARSAPKPRAKTTAKPKTAVKKKPATTARKTSARTR
jgi:hypothetical protein